MAGPPGVQPVPPESLVKVQDHRSGIRRKSEIQNPESKVQNAEAPTPIPDSLPGIKPGGVPAETAVKQDTTRHGPPARTPRIGTAVLLSALIPGGGQFYAGYPWQGAIIGAAELTFAGLSVYEYRRGKTDLGNAFLWWTGFSIGFSMADAYVSTALFGFKEEQRLDLQVGPCRTGVAYRF